MKRTRDNVEILQVQIEALRQARRKSTEEFDREIGILETRLRHAGGAARPGLSPASNQADYVAEDVSGKGGRRKRTHLVGPEARARIAAAQKKRWADFNKAKAKAKKALKQPAERAQKSRTASPDNNEVEAALTEFTA